MTKPTKRAERELGSEPLAHLRHLPFVRNLDYRTARAGSDTGYAGQLKIRTSSDKFSLFVEVRASYLSDASVNELRARADRLPAPQRLVLLARHVPRPIADRLISSKINFADLAGNVHLELGDRYNWTAIGRPEQKPISVRRAATPADIQLLFRFATNSDSINWPVRQLEKAVGISKSKAAQARRQLIAEGLLVREGKQYELGPMALLSDRLVSGYSQILRPKLLLNRFRYPEKQPEDFLRRLRAEARSIPPLQYALTGGVAADLLQHFYRSPEISLFIGPWSSSVPERLRLLTDREGPVIALRAFGDVVFWRETDGHMIAPPWLIYAELLSSSDPRAHEAAEQLRQTFLQ
jgi:hypothetical protein